MTMHLNAQWKTSRFFQNENKSGYAVSLQTKEKYPLSKEDTKTLIDILSAYNWEENRKQDMSAIDIKDRQIGWWAYHYYIYDYYIAITHPDKRKVTLRINSGGIGKDEFLIEYFNGKPFGAFRLNSNSRLSDDDIKKIKQLFLKNNVDFGSITFNNNETVKIKSTFSFYEVFYNLEIPAAPIDSAQNKQFIRLYNSGWNNSAESGGGDPLPVWRLYACDKTISYDKDYLNVALTGSANSVLFDLSKLNFKDADKQKLEELVNNILKGHDGEGEQTMDTYVNNEKRKQKITYQYKDGLLHGQVKKFSPGGKLTDEVTYDKGLPICYIKYADRGIKEKEIHFIPSDMSLTWTKYDEKGNAIKSGKTKYQLWYYNYDEYRNFDNSNSLIFMGRIIANRELFPIQTDNISSLKIIHQSIGYSYNLTYVLSPLENKVYTVYDNGVTSPMDIKGYTHIRQLIFKNKSGKLFFIPVGDSRLCEISIPVDETSLRQVFYNYYTDKNGLYFYDSFKNWQQIESSNGKPIQPVLHDSYLVYGDAAYPYGHPSGNDKTQKDIRLDANELSLIKTVYGQYLGDKNKLFVLPSAFMTTAIAFISPANLIQEGMPPEPVSEWKFFDIITVGGNLKENTLYYSSKKIYAGSGSYYSLIKTPNGFYGITGSSMSLKAVKFDNIMIYNVEKNDYEPIEIEHFHRLTDNFYIYKNQMYGYNSQPLETELNIQKLHTICLNGRATEFYTDGTFLLGGYNLSKMNTVQKGEQTWYKFEEPLFRDVDWKSLQIVNEKVMVDKNNIYKVEDSFLQVTPIKDFGPEVIVIPVMDK